MLSEVYQIAKNASKKCVNLKYGLKPFHFSLRRIPLFNLFRFTQRTLMIRQFVTKHITRKHARQSGQIVCLNEFCNKTNFQMKSLYSTYTALQGITHSLLLRAAIQVGGDDYDAKH
jgi:hypothetical protein